MGPFAPRAKRALELAVGEALTLGSTSIETEHILLGLVRDNESPATRTLIGSPDAELPHPEPVRRDREFDLEIRNAVIRRLSEREEPSNGVGFARPCSFSSQGVGAMHVVTVRLRRQPVRGPGVLRPRIRSFRPDVGA